MKIINIENLPRLRGKKIRGFTMKSLPDLKKLGTISLRQGLSLADVAQKTGIPKENLTSLGITSSGIDIHLLVRNLREGGIPEGILLRKGEERTIPLEKVARVIVGRSGPEDVVLNPFSYDEHAAWLDASGVTPVPSHSGGIGLNFATLFDVLTRGYAQEFLPEFEAVRFLLTSDSPRVKIRALVLLRYFPEQARRKIVDIIPRAGAKEVSFEIAAALGALGIRNEKVVSILTELLHTSAQYDAIEALCRLNVKEKQVVHAIGERIKELQYSDGLPVEVKPARMRALQALGVDLSESIKDRIADLRSPDWMKRHSAINSLRVIGVGNKEVRDALLALRLNEGRGGYQETTSLIEALWRIGFSDAEVGNRLLELLNREIKIDEKEVFSVGLHFSRDAAMALVKLGLETKAVVKRLPTLIEKAEEAIITQHGLSARADFWKITNIIKRMLANESQAAILLANADQILAALSKLVRGKDRYTVIPPAAIAMGLLGCKDEEVISHMVQMAVSPLRGDELTSIPEEAAQALAKTMAGAEERKGRLTNHLLAQLDTCEWPALRRIVFTLGALGVQDEQLLAVFEGILSGEHTSPADIERAIRGVKTMEIMGLGGSKRVTDALMDGIRRNSYSRTTIAKQLVAMLSDSLEAEAKRKYIARLVEENLQQA